MTDVLQSTEIVPHTENERREKGRERKRNGRGKRVAGFHQTMPLAPLEVRWGCIEREKAGEQGGGGEIKKTERYFAQPLDGLRSLCSTVSWLSSTHRTRNSQMQQKSLSSDDRSSLTEAQKTTMDFSSLSP